MRGLRITPDGLLLQDVAPDPNTNANGEFLWGYAVRRRAGAADIAGLCQFTTMDRWHETLKAYFLKTPRQVTSRSLGGSSRMPTARSGSRSAKIVKMDAKPITPTPAA